MPRTRDDDTTESFLILTRLIAKLRLQLEATRLVMRDHGVTADEFVRAESVLKERWYAASDTRLERIKKKRSDEGLAKLLRDFEGPEQ